MLLLDYTKQLRKMLVLLIVIKFTPLKAQQSQLRLVGGNYSAGRVEIYLNGMWGTVCDDLWDFLDADVVCRQLGFPGAISAPRNAAFGEGSDPTHLDDVECTGEETDILSCPHTTTENCGHYEDAGVVCISVSSEGPTSTTQSLLIPPVIEAIRLTGGSTSAEGRVEVFVQGEWGTICDDNWDINDAHVVCRQLGFESAVDAPIEAFFGAGTGRIWLNGVKCTGNERIISNCTSHKPDNGYCLHHEDAGVKCLVTVKIDQIILTRGMKPEEGMVEVSIDKEGGALCDDDHWGVANSYVVCRQLGYDSAVTLQKGSFSMHETVRTWNYYFQCSGDEKRLDDCFTGMYDNNYTCNVSLVYVVCLSYSTGTVSNPEEDSNFSYTWIFIVGILLLVIAVSIYIVMKRLNVSCIAKPSNNGVQEKSAPSSIQLPLQNAPFRDEHKYETIDMPNISLYHTVASEKPANALCDTSYEVMLGNFGGFAPEKSDEVDSKRHLYAKTIIDDCAVTVDNTAKMDFRTTL